MDTSNQQGFNGLLHPSNFYPGLLQPTFMAATPTVALGDMYYSQDGVNFIRLPVGANGAILGVSNKVPAYIAPGTSGQVLTISGGAPVWQTPVTVSSGLLQSCQQSTTLANSSTSSTSYVDGISITWTPTATANILVMLSVDWYNSAINVQSLGRITLDGTALGTDPSLQYDIATSLKAITVATQVYSAGVDTNSHTVKFQFKSSSGAATVSINSAILTILVFTA